MCTGGRDNFFLDLSVFLERKVYDFRIMVGKEFLCLPVFFRNVAALYLYLGSDKYEVNFLTRVSRNASEVMEGIAGTFLLESSLMCILQHEAVAGDGLVASDWSDTLKSPVTTAAGRLQFLLFSQ